MDLWPAIDIRDGKCVRLHRGDFDTVTEYGDPVEVATQYLEAGAKQLHVVDLDAARTGDQVNIETILRIVRRTGLMIQAGGGVRDEEAAAALLDHGVARVVVGTAALDDDQSVLRAVLDRWPGRVAVGLDYRAGRDQFGDVTHELAVQGWAQRSGVPLERALAQLAWLPLAGVIVTDIERDGTGTGPDLVLLGELLDSTDLPIIASGGIGAASDIARLARLKKADRKLSGVIVGKALLSGSLTVADATRAALELTR
ncbi:MAG: HisA/HisF-related TIM barrel protein [Acidimicrobiales bacterium]